MFTLRLPSGQARSMGLVDGRALATRIRTLGVVARVESTLEWVGPDEAALGPGFVAFVHRVGHNLWTARLPRSSRTRGLSQARQFPGHSTLMSELHQLAVACGEDERRLGPGRDRRKLPTPTVDERIRAVADGATTRLDLKAMDLTRVPDQVETLAPLQHLDLANNRFDRVPDWLWHLPSLRSVSLTGNQLRELQIETCSAPLHHLDLQNLDLSGTRLGLGGCDRLQSVDLSFTSLYRPAPSAGLNRPAPSAGLNRPAPSAGYSVFAGVDFDIDRDLPPSVRTLRLSDCGLTEPPPVTAAGPDLTHLDLSWNQLTGFDPAPTMALPNLARLNLDGNPITTISSLDGLDQIHDLGLAATLIDELPEVVTGLSRLRALHLEDTRITSWPSGLDRLGDLSVIGAALAHFVAPLPPPVAGRTTIMGTPELSQP